MSNAGKTIRWLWAILGLPIVLLFLFSKSWGWLIQLWCFGGFAIPFIDPAQRAQLNKPVGMPTVVAGLCVPAFFLSYAAIKICENPLSPVLGILLGLSLLAFLIYWRWQRFDKPQEILKDL